MNLPELPNLHILESALVVDVRNITDLVISPFWHYTPRDEHGFDDPKWTELGWPENEALIASETSMEEGWLVNYYSTIFPKFASQRHVFENRDTTLAASFVKRHEIWLAVHSLLYYQDQVIAGNGSASEGAIGLTIERSQEDPVVAEEGEKQERCRIGVISSLYAAREVQMEIVEPVSEQGMIGVPRETCRYATDAEGILADGKRYPSGEMRKAREQRIPRRLRSASVEMTTLRRGRRERLGMK